MPCVTPRGVVPVSADVVDLDGPVASPGADIVQVSKQVRSGILSMKTLAEVGFREKGKCRLTVARSYEF